MSLATSYNALLRSGKIKADEPQRVVLQKLENLTTQLNAPKRRSFFAKFLRIKFAPLRGLYIWGDVGRGKTMLMDLFFTSVKNPKKRRVHFHAFMQEIHAKRAILKSDDVISEIAEEIASSTTLLCLDEMQISDIADAMIIGRLFEALQLRSVCFVTTSNLPPSQLYKDGLNRHLFLPFINKIETDLEVIHLDDGLDYRLGRIASRQIYLSPLGKSANAAMDQIWNDLTDGASGMPMELDFLGRKLRVPLVARYCARFSFSDLCENPLSAPDYLAITKNFSTVFVDRIPIFKTTQRNEVKRFILMIDTFYDAGTRLVASAAAKPERLYPTGQHRGEFSRTASRLLEMQSASWWKAT